MAGDLGLMNCKQSTQHRHNQNCTMLDLKTARGMMTCNWCMPVSAQPEARSIAPFPSPLCGALQADIGLSMGIAGTEVAKESSDIVISGRQLHDHCGGMPPLHSPPFNNIAQYCTMQYTKSRWPRRSSDIVILDDNFTTIVGVCRLFTALSK